MDGILLLSDMHVGKPDFSEENAHQRVMYFIGQLKEKCPQAKRMHVVLAGDIVDGENIYPRQSWELTESVNEQVHTAFNVLVDIIDYLYSRYGQGLRVYSVEGNHGRTSKHSYGNWDTAVAQLLAVEMNHRGIEYVIAGWREPLFFEAGGQTILAVHGDGIRMYMNIPFYGIYRRVMAWAHQYRFDTVLLGHFHSLNYYRVANKHVFLNGTWHYQDGFAFEKGLIPSFYQWCIMIEDGDIVSMHPIPTYDPEQDI